MALKVSISNPTGQKVTFGTTSKPLTIKSSSAATKLSTLTDIDLTSAESTESGATLVYDENTGTYKGEKVFEYDGNEVTLKGGSF
jgi:hypothetical protein